MVGSRDGVTYLDQCLQSGTCELDLTLGKWFGFVDRSLEFDSFPACVTLGKLPLRYLVSLYVK